VGIADRAESSAFAADIETGKVSPSIVDKEA